ncbi:MAG: PHD finger domain-containing protein, partial [Candidatus Thiodiazotropha endolucinida]|nr:PHD finger domain-containing protein [Candidatus Thiodiazotropha endolucinida]
MDSDVTTVGGENINNIDPSGESDICDNRIDILCPICDKNILGNAHEQVLCNDCDMLFHRGCVTRSRNDKELDSYICDFCNDDMLYGDSNTQSHQNSNISPDEPESRSSTVRLKLTDLGDDLSQNKCIEQSQQPSLGADPIKPLQISSANPRNSQPSQLTVNTVLTGLKPLLFHTDRPKTDNSPSVSQFMQTQSTHDTNPGIKNARKCSDTELIVAASKNDSHVESNPNIRHELVSDVPLTSQGQSDTDSQASIIETESHKKPDSKLNSKNPNSIPSTDPSTAILNGNTVDPIQPKSKKSSKSQTKQKTDIDQLMQTNKQQSDCIVELERKLNELNQFNDILQKRLNLSGGVLNERPRDSYSPTHHPEIPQNPQLNPKDPSELKTHHERETNMFPSLVYQMMIDNRIMENRM